MDKCKIMKNEMLKGEIDYPLPLEADEFEYVMANLLEGCEWSVKELGYFEDALAENDSLAMMEHAVTCLRDFCTTVGTIDSKVLHPADMDKILKNEEFMVSFRTIVRRIKEYDFIGRLRTSNETEERGAEHDEDVIQGLIESAEEYLMQAEIYLATN